jgi:hypothetical protein
MADACREIPWKLIVHTLQKRESLGRFNPLRQKLSIGLDSGQKSTLCISKKAFACFAPDRSLAGNKKGVSAVWPSKRAIDVAAKMFALHVEQSLQYERGDSGRHGILNA